MSSLGGVDCSDLKPPRPNGQIKFQYPAETDFDPEIALALTASGWRAAAALLTLAAKLIEAGDFLSAERNRRHAREQFNAATDVFRQFQEARAAEGESTFSRAARHSAAHGRSHDLCGLVEQLAQRKAPDAGDAQ
jgi:hypothetical protein